MQRLAGKGCEFGQTSINLQPKWEIFKNFNLKGQFSFRLNSDVYPRHKGEF